jgi:nucleotide-binding universal stress UspA family protein
MDKVIHKKTFSKILVAINESSKSADKAVDYATKIAQDYNSLLIILYVIRAQANLQTLNLPSHIIQFKKQAESYLSKISEKIYTQSEAEDIVRFKTEIIASLRIADAIVSYAKDNHIDLIVLGPRGRSKLKSLVLGSVTSDVVRLARCPVLTVR